MGITLTPDLCRSSAVPPVDTISTPMSASPLVNSPTPVLSVTLTIALWIFFMQILPVSWNFLENDIYITNPDGFKGKNAWGNTFLEKGFPPGPLSKDFRLSHGGRLHERII